MSYLAKTNSSASCNKIARVVQSVERQAKGWTAGVQESFLYSAASRSTLEPTQPHIQWALGTIFPRVKLPEREADHSPPSSAEVKNSGAITPLPHTSSCRGT
jgi:hypothetical protein